MLPRLLAKGITGDELYDAVTTMQVELVLTAHPTEITRRTLRRKFNEISETLSAFDLNETTPTQHQLERLRRRILSHWHTDEIRRHKPSPVDEAKWGFATVEETLWKALPDFLQGLDQQLLEHTGKHLPLTATPIRFTLWMGGDRDGNPYVTAEVTEQIITLGRWQAADLLFNDINELREDLSITECNQTLRDIVGPSPGTLPRIFAGCSSTITTQQPCLARFNYAPQSLHRPTAHYPSRINAALA